MALTQATKEALAESEAFSNKLIAISMVIVVVLIIVLIVAVVVVVVRGLKRRRRLKEVSCTEIVQSIHGNVTFVVQYDSGDREIVTVNENTRMCREYARKLKTSDSGN